jgi:D-alanyl-D-alanine carboxypeptidase
MSQLAVNSRFVGLAFLLSFPNVAVGQASSADIRTAVDSIARAALESGLSASYQVGVKRGAEVIVDQGFGSADLEHDIAASSRTIYRLGSITKQFTAAAIMQLVEAGQVSLDDEITKYFPEYPTQGHTVTVKHLLTHTSGIKSYTELGEKFWNNAARDLSHEEMLEIFANEPFDFAPGERFLYNNSGFYLLGMIVEKVSGQGYDDYLQQKIFGPLEMSGSSYCHESMILKGRAEGYRTADGGFINDPPISMNTPGAAGALCSTVNDLVWWQDAFNNDRVVSAASRALMTTPAVLNDGSATGYGFGLRLGEFEGHEVIEHGGGIHGFNTRMSYFPDQDLTVVVLANTEGSRPDQMVRAIARVALGVEVSERVEVSVSERTLQTYVGEYQLAPTFSMTITVEEGALFGQATGQAKVPMFAESETKFFLKVVDAQMTFNRDADGVVTGITLHQNGNNVPGRKVNE